MQQRADGNSGEGQIKILKHKAKAHYMGNIRKKCGYDEEQNKGSWLYRLGGE